jgi:DNA-binding transcriptional LysR family regulator
MGLDRWTFEKDGRQVSLRLEGRVVSSANEAAVRAAVAELGIAATGIIASRNALASRALVRVLPDWDMGAVDVHAVFPAGRATKAGARALAEHMVGAFGTKEPRPAGRAPRLPGPIRGGGPGGS